MESKDAHLTKPQGAKEERVEPTTPKEEKRLSVMEPSQDGGDGEEGELRPAHSREVMWASAWCST